MKFSEKSAYHDLAAFFTSFSSIKHLWILFLLLTLPFFPGATSYRVMVLETHRPQFRSLPIVLPSPAPYPKHLPGSFTTPGLTASAAVVLDVDSQVVLYQKEAAKRLLPASTTKMLTALVTIEQCRLDRILTVGSLHLTEADSKMGIATGEQFTVERLLYGLLLASGNDAAHVLASYCKTSTQDFVSLMNSKAQELHMVNSHFTNPVGLEEQGHFSSAQDLARLASEFIKNPILSKIAATKEVTVSDVSQKRLLRLENRNTLLTTVAGVNGVKTGYTANAGECIVISATRDGHTIIVSLLGSQDRVLEATELVNWAFASHQWELLGE